MMKPALARGELTGDDGGKPQRGRQGYFAVGVRASGLYGPPMGEWRLNGSSDLTSGPDAAMAGFYAALTLGFGGRRVIPSGCVSLPRSLSALASAASPFRWAHARRPLR